MSGWSRTVKPVIPTIDPDDIYGVDANEAAATDGVPGPGWVYRRTVGTRVLHELLVAMKVGPTEDDADDTVFPDMVFIIVTAPEAATVQAGAVEVLFTIEVEASLESYAGTIGYAWEVSLDDGETWDPVDGDHFDGDATEELSSTALLDETYDGALFRCVVTDTDGDTGATITSDPVALTVTPAPTTTTTEAPTTTTTV